jgi:hypothetical protein
LRTISAVRSCHQLSLAALWALALGCVASPSGGGSSRPCCTATIVARVPEGTGTVYLAGSLPELGPWHPDGRSQSLPSAAVAIRPS